MQAVGGEIVQQDDYGRLWRTQVEVGGEPLLAVEVVNATVDADGSRRHYFLARAAYDSVGAGGCGLDVRAERARVLDCSGDVRLT